MFSCPNYCPWHDISQWNPLIVGVAPFVLKPRQTNAMKKNSTRCRKEFPSRPTIPFYFASLSFFLHPSILSSSSSLSSPSSSSPISSTSPLHPLFFLALFFPSILLSIFQRLSLLVLSLRLRCSALISCFPFSWANSVFSVRRIGRFVWLAHVTFFFGQC